MEKYTLEEIAKHNTEESLWLIINGKVYDVTKFLEEHPGGPKAFLNRGGKDATRAFNSIQNHAASPDLPAFMETLCVGEVEVPVDEQKEED